MSASRNAPISGVVDQDTVGEAITESDRRVYIVDDDSMVRQALFFALRAGGFSPRSFSSGEDFLQECEDLPDGCVLLDLRMPSVDGMAVLDRLGEQIGRLPVVIMTAHGEVSSAVAAMKRGASDFVEKPFAGNSLLETLESVFERRPADQGAMIERREAVERLERLTPREVDVLQCIVAGFSNKQVARHFGLSVRTVEVHRASLMSRLEVSSLAEAVRLALVAGLEPLAAKQSA